MMRHPSLKWRRLMILRTARERTGGHTVTVVPPLLQGDFSEQLAVLQKFVEQKIRN